jgi:putative chitobiose transport system permease protein
LNSTARDSDQLPASAAQRGFLEVRAAAGPAMRMLLAVVATLAFGVPIFWMMLSSVRPPTEILANLFPLKLDGLLPGTLTLVNYQELADIGFYGAVWNSVVATALTVVFGLLISVPAAFALAVLNFRGRSLVFALIMAAFILPFDILSFPLARAVARLGLSNTYIALVVPLICSGFAIFLLRQFFMAIPRSLYEAARVDGASIFRVMTAIYVPLSRPVIVATGSDIYRFEIGQIIAASCVLFLVPAVVMLLFQRSFVRSFATSGISQ